MPKFTAGRFEADIWTDGHPIMIIVKADGKEVVRFTHHELRDLRFVLKRAMRRTKQNLNGKDKLDV